MCDAIICLRCHDAYHQDNMEDGFQYRFQNDQYLSDIRNFFVLGGGGILSCW
jgi:hypothetical protein